MSKRKHEDQEDVQLKKKQPGENIDTGRKHTLDSDEEDESDLDEKYNVLDDEDFEGEEEGVPDVVDDVKITPFNMKEELEEGHFDKDGHFHWDKNKQVTDNWLDNIDWIKIKKDANYSGTKESKGLGDDSESEDENAKKFDLVSTYEKILELMKPNESVKKSLQRLGAKSSKLSSVERWRLKKAGVVDESSILVTKLTELCNELLTQTGNMDIYEEKYEDISKKIKKGKSSVAGSSKMVVTDDNLDMYADDFDSKEKKKLKVDDSEEEEEEEEEVSKKLMWEYKYKPDEDEKIHGPFSTEQMQNYVEEGHFKDGVLVRKVNSEDAKFYTSNRIDFELYL